MDQSEFINIIRACRRKLNIAGFLIRLVFSLSVGAVVGIVFQAAAFVLPLYYANIYTGIAFLSAVVTAAALSLIKRSTMEHAALVMDGFGFKERIITAYEHLKDEGALFVLQRKDAMEQLRAHRERIRIPLWPDRKRTGLMVTLLVAMVVLAFVPSPMKDRAEELHRIRQEARDKEKEIEEVLEELEKLEESEEEALTPEQLAALQEMMESLQSSMSEYQQASSAEALQAAGEKLNYKYENMSSRMSDLAESIRGGATASPMSAESMQAMADKLQQMSGNASQNGGDFASNQGQNGDSQDDGQNGKGNDQNGQSNGQSSQGNGKNGQGQGDASGQGNGQGNGKGSGQNGQGNGQSGQGNGTGTGRGTGTANNAHDYVSIPNAIADSENLTGNVVDHDNSEYFRAQNGLSWEGTHMSYEAVIGSYEQNAYEGIAAGRYPSGMENVIKEYFSSFN